MRVALFCLVVAVAALPARAGEIGACADCHGQEATGHAVGVHATPLGCTDCHGGDPTGRRDKEKAHAASAGYVGKPPRDMVPALCGGCHGDPLRMYAYGLPTDQLVQYRNSGHGKALFEKGDSRTAVCTDCHGVHGILSARDPRAPTARANQPETCGRCHADGALMEPYGLDVSVVERFRRSVHGIALLEEETRGAPACSDCHGSHGATPPGIGAVAQVCAHCHEHTGEEYRKSPHAASPEMRCRACHAEEKGVAYRASGCAVCHGSHDIARTGGWLFEGEEPGRCDHCHRDASEIAAVREAILGGMRRLKASMREARRELETAKESGLFLEHERIYLRESERALVSVLPLAHSLDPEAIAKHLEDGLQRQGRVREELARKMRVLRDRRILLGGLAAILLLFTALLAAKLHAVRRLS